jgi:hypothetical protein
MPPSWLIAAPRVGASSGESCRLVPAAVIPRRDTRRLGGRRVFQPALAPSSEYRRPAGTEQGVTPGMHDTRLPALGLDQLRFAVHQPGYREPCGWPEPTQELNGASGHQPNVRVEHENRRIGLGRLHCGVNSRRLSRVASHFNDRGGRCEKVEHRHGAVGRGVVGHGQVPANPLMPSSSEVQRSSRSSALL